MTISDGELVRLWNARGGQWQRVLANLQRNHTKSLGRAAGKIHWLGSPEEGPWSWFGYFWEPERFWFGYGLHGDDWRPLIEADTRSAHARSWQHLTAQLPGLWTVTKSADYLRLWAPDDLGEGTRAQEKWLRDRSHELHEYALGER